MDCRPNTRRIGSIAKGRVDEHRSDRRAEAADGRLDIVDDSPALKAFRGSGQIEVRMGDVNYDVTETAAEMIKEGTLPRPKRTVRFLWVLEISGTRAYLTKHPELGQHVVASISTDMVGANQTINHNSLHLNQTMYSIPSVRQ